MKRAVLIGVIIFMMVVGCGSKHNYDFNNNEFRMEGKLDSVSLNAYKLKNRWVPLDYPESLVVNPYLVPFNQLKVGKLPYDEAVKIYGAPAYEYTDTIIHGMNIATGKPDYDLYPLLCDRDTVIVERCWWVKYMIGNRTLYLVFERQEESAIAFYGYLYTAGRHVN